MCQDSLQWSAFKADILFGRWKPLTRETVKLKTNQKKSVINSLEKIRGMNDLNPWGRILNYICRTE